MIDGAVAVSEDTNAAPMQTESELDFIESIISVSERDGAARIFPLRTENSGDAYHLVDERAHRQCRQGLYRRGATDDGRCVNRRRHHAVRFTGQ